MHKTIQLDRDLFELSTDEAKRTLENVLIQDPQLAKGSARRALERLPVPNRDEYANGMSNGRLSRIAMLRTIIKRADKLLAKSK